MEVQIVSKKLIVPSTPNKEHPHRMKLSRIDELAPRSYVVLIIYYAETETGDKTDRVTRMETSLANTLSVFHPFAGRFNEDDLSIDCNNHGAEFIEAKVPNCMLNDFLLPRDGQEPDPELLSHFVPARYEHSGEAPLVCVQVNVFECGGIALALSMSHVLCDAYTMALFLNAWASSSRNTDRVVDRAYHPSFDLASIFPPRDTPAVPLPRTDRAGIVTRRFVFDGRAMKRLRSPNGNAGKGKPSRVRVVTGLLWRAMMRAKGRVRPSLAILPVNLRGRTKNVAIPPNSCGNFATLSVALFNPKGEEDDGSVELHELVGDAIGNAFTKASSVLDADGLMAMLEKDWREAIEAIECDDRDTYGFTSWCRMGHYEADFGWGGPSWISSFHVPLDGFTLLMDARDGEGIEAWLSSELPTMLLLQQDPDIVAFTSNNHGRAED